MRVRLVMILVACGVVVGAGATTGVTVLHIQNARTDETVGIERIDPGQEFAIHYTHSFDKTPIHEVYVIRDGKIVQIREEFQYFAIGLEYTEREQERVGNFTVLHMERPFDSFALRVATYTNQSLVIDDERTPLTDYSDRWETLTFSAERISYLEYAYLKATAQV
ncbi:DUF1850 domain-containing protein [Haladaptatus caseinilyticus]|uniref:DUF1850 domain-containing protein n=1 Tax=Haladaptatus caseinilyticus TaxID=2993314 RepID=UPI00224B1C7A|nr:DUF1850 domain-containing protein [Haladaptatus caseinilyticus]